MHAPEHFLQKIRRKQGVLNLSSQDKRKYQNSHQKHI